MIYSLQSDIETCMTMEEVSAMTGGQRSETGIHGCGGEN